MGLVLGLFQAAMAKVLGVDAWQLVLAQVQSSA